MLNKIPDGHNGDVYDLIVAGNGDGRIRIGWLKNVRKSGDRLYSSLELRPQGASAPEIVILSKHLEEILGELSKKVVKL